MVLVLVFVSGISERKVTWAGHELPGIFRHPLGYLLESNASHQLAKNGDRCVVMVRPYNGSREAGPRSNLRAFPAKKRLGIHHPKANVTS